MKTKITALTLEMITNPNNTIQDLNTLEATNNINRDILRASLSKFRKDKALELIGNTYSSFKPAEDYTVRINIDLAHEQIQYAIDAARLNLTQVMESEDTAANQSQSIDTLLDALKTATKAAKKNIRAKLRRLGYRLSDQEK